MLTAKAAALGALPALPCHGRPSVGLSLRQHFIGQAMQGLCANASIRLDTTSGDYIAILAIEHANALLERLAAEPC